MIGLPIVVLAAWAASALGTQHSDAEVDISAQHPTELRGAVVAAINAAGGVRIAEDTSYSGAGSSQLTFHVPTARLEQATEALGGLGGHITDQRIDLVDASSQAAGVSQKLTDAQSCMSGVQTAQPSAARDALSKCQTEIADVASRLDNSKVDLSTTDLVVKITAPSSENLPLIAAILLVVAVAIGVGVMIKRIDDKRLPPVVREIEKFPAEELDLHRQN